MLAGAEKGNVARRDLRFQQQRVIERHDLDDVAPRQHHATLGVDQQPLDGAAHRRADLGLLHAVGQADAALCKTVERCSGFREFVAPGVAKVERDLLDLAFGLIDSRPGAGHLRGGLLALATQARDIALETQDFHLRHGAGCEQGLGLAQFLRGQFVVARRLLVERRGLLQFLAALGELLPGDAGLTLQLGEARLVQAGFGRGELRRLGEHLRRHVKGLALGERRQACGLGEQ